MAWGVLEDRQTPFPPGTIRLDDSSRVEQDEEDGSDGSSTSELKKTRNTVLQPQPSDSPNDPLNWSLKVKMALFVTLIVTITAIAGILGMLGTAGRILAEQYGVNFPTVVRTLQPPSIAAGAIALFFASAIGAVWGKRFPILVAVFVIWITMIIGYFANSLDYYRAVNIVINVFGTAPELLSAPLVTDLIFVHQRGRVMAITSVVAIIGIDASSIISGNIIEKLGVKYLYVVSFGVMGFILLLNFFLLRETTYHRGASRKAFEKTDDHVYDEAVKDPLVLGQEHSNLSTSTTLSSFFETADSATEPKRPWTWYLHIYYGRVSSRNFIKAFLQPFPLLLFPSVLFSTIVNGAMLTWAQISSIISAQVLLYPPYDIQPARLSYLSLPGSAAALVASVVSGYLSDWQIKWMAKRNGGVYEPEFRLLMLIPAVIFSTLGFLLLGPMYERQAPVWQIILANLLFSIGMPFGSSACTTYILDTMQNTSSEAFVATTLFKSIYMFLATYYVPGWFADNGATVTYRALAILNVAFAVVGIPMYLLGKRWRGLVSRNAFLRKMAGHDL